MVWILLKGHDTPSQVCVVGWRRSSLGCFKSACELFSTSCFRNSSQPVSVVPFWTQGFCPSPAGTALLMSTVAQRFWLTLQDLSALSAVSNLCWHGTGDLAIATAATAQAESVRIWSESSKSWAIFYPDGEPFSPTERPLDSPLLPRPLFRVPTSRAARRP